MKAFKEVQERTTDKLEQKALRLKRDYPSLTIMDLRYILNVGISIGIEETAQYLNAFMVK